MICSKTQESTKNLFELFFHVQECQISEKSEFRESSNLNHGKLDLLLVKLKYSEDKCCYSNYIHQQALSLHPFKDMTVLGLGPFLELFSSVSSRPDSGIQQCIENHKSDFFSVFTHYGQKLLSSIMYADNYCEDVFRG